MKSDVIQETRKIKICHIASADITLKFLLMPQLIFLHNEGYDVYAVSSAGKWISDIEKEGVKVKTIKITRKISPIEDLVSLFQLFFYFKKEKFDIVHTHTPKPELLGQLAAKMAGVPIVIDTIHGLYFQKSSSPLKRKLFIFINKISSKCSNLIFSQNKEDISTLIKEKIANPEIIKYLGNGVDIKKFNPERFTEDFILRKKQELNINPDFKVVGVVGRLVKEKGYLELFSAFKEVLKKFPKTLLLVIGPEEPDKKDSFSPEIVKSYGIEKNTIFLGERIDVDEIYSLMDIFVLASYREGFPRTVLEAMAEERPVIATDIRGCREEIESGKTGILSPVKNPEKLAEGISYLLSNPKTANEMGKNGRIKVIKEFDERLVFDRIKEQYKRLIGEKLDRRPMEHPGEKGFQRIIKRLFDIVGSISGLILLSPFFLMIAILVKLDSPGPVFFKQERIGKDGKPFYPFKFRTMVEGAVNKGLGYTVSKNDDRITKIGGFLRKWGVDELPQLVNVLTGEMSLVGPRPTLRYQVEKYNDFEKRRLLVKPGLAGWALVHGRNSLTWEERIKYDVWYVDNWSFLLDIKIIFMTFYLIFIKQEGVYGKDGVNDLFKR